MDKLVFDISDISDGTIACYFNGRRITSHTRFVNVEQDRSYLIIFSPYAAKPDSKEMPGKCN